ncbi:MAG: STAS domain-containing protein [bacterium]
MVREDEFVPKPGDVIVLHLESTLNDTQAEKIRLRIEEASRTGIRYIIFDFREVSSIDPDSLKTLDPDVKRYLVTNHQASACNIRPDLNEILKQAEFPNAIEIFDSEEDALSFRNRRECALLTRIKSGD